MSLERKQVDENALDEVVGGLFNWNPSNDSLTFIHDDGSVSKYHVNDYDKAWSYSNELHAQNYRETTIIKKLKSKGYIS